jgi:hypothetical protein
MAAIGRPSDALDMVVLAWEGREVEARAKAAAVTRFAAEQSQGWMLAFVNYGLTVLELGLGHYREAFTCATKNYQDNPFLNIVGFADLIEAACRCDERAVATEAAEEFISHTLPNGTPLSLGLVALSRALLADDGDAEPLYQQAIDHLVQCRGNLRKARSHLLYGEWLRRKTDDSTPALSSARPMTCSPRWERTALRSAPERNSPPPASTPVSEVTRPVAISLRRRHRSHFSLLKAPPTPR